MTASTETGSLILKTDSTQVVKGKVDLDNLAQSAAQAQSTVDALSKAFSPVASAIDRLTAAIQTGVGQMDKLASAQQQVVAASAKMDAANKQAAKSTEQVGESADDASARIKAMVAASLSQAGSNGKIIESETSLAERMGLRTEATAAQIAATKAQVAAQDRQMVSMKAVADAEAKVAASTAASTAAVEANSAAMTINGTTARELGIVAGELARGNFTRLEGSMITLANRAGLMSKVFSPLGMAIGAAVGAAALLVSAYVKGQQETDAYNKALILTGNVAGTTSGQLASMAKSLATVTGSQHAAAAALAAVTGSGKFTADQIQLVTTAALQMQQATGQAIGDTVKQFSDLAGDPSQAIAKLNDEQHFLTLSLYDQITALQNLGRSQDAADLAEKTYADSLAERTAQIKSNLGTLQTAWNTVGTAAKNAWDRILDIGRPESDDEKIGDLQQRANELGKQLDALKNAAPLSGSGYGNLGNQARAQEIADLQAKFDAAKKAYYAAEDSQTAAEQAAQQKASTQTAQDLGIRLSQEAAQYASAEVKRAQLIAKAHGEANAAIAAAEKVQDADLRAKLIANAKANEQAIIAGIQSKAPKPKKAKADPFTSLNNLVQNAQVQDAGNGGKQDTVLDQQAAAILKIVDAGAKLITSGQDVAKVQALVATGVSAVNDKYAKQAAQLKQQNIVAVQQYQASLDKQNDALQRTIQSQIDKIGMGDKEYQQQQQINQLYVQGAQALSDLQLKRDAVAAKGGDTSVLDQDIARLKTNTDKQVAIVTQGYAQMDKAQGDWMNGFTTAFANFNDQAANVATASAQVFTNAFSGMTTALTNFVTTGKGGFKSFTVSVLTDLAKMEIQIAESKALQAILGSFLGAGNTATSFDSNGTFFSPYAKGGVVSSPSLSAYSGQIVNRPTPFLFASGAGIMGEAGPEAILPLKRGSDGKLGVQAGGSNGGVTVNTTVNVSSDGSATTDVNSNSAYGKQIGSLISSKMKETMLKEQRPGGILWKMAHS